MNDETVKKTVREGYARVAEGQGNCCCGTGPGCCGGATPEEVGLGLGYTEQQLVEAPDGANLGLGCGNPLALAAIAPGMTVLDLGSGAGFDCFLAARHVGPDGRVIGVDLTPAMIERARRNAGQGGFTNVEFRLGEIENLPVEDASIDVVISNCVINLSPDKARVFQEAFRVLKPGGRLLVSDIVLLAELPPEVRASAEAYVGCVAGAVLRDDYLSLVAGAGFTGVRVLEAATGIEHMQALAGGPGRIQSLKLSATKP